MSTTALPNDRMEGGYKPMPLMLSIPLLLLCLAGGGFIIHWYVHTGALVKETSILGAVPPDGKTRYLKPNDQKPPTGWTGHTELADTDLKTDAGTVTVTRMVFDAGGRLPNFLPDETRRTLEGAYWAGKQKKIGNATLSADVVKAIDNQAQKSDATIVLSDADKGRLIADFNAFTAASGDEKVAAEIKVLSTIDEIARAYEPVAIENAKQQVEAIQKILPPDQFAELKAMAPNGRGPGGPGGPGRAPRR